jgi:hypothetical protein
MTDMVHEADVTLDRLEAIFNGAFMRTRRSQDESLEILEGGFRTSVTISPDTLLISLDVVCELKASFTDVDKLGFINSVNADLLEARCGMADPAHLWVDHSIAYGGGLVPLQLVSTFRRFLSACGVVRAADSAGMIGKD